MGHKTDKDIEMMEDYLKNKKIFVCEKANRTESEEVTIKQRGHQIYGQPCGCYRVPSHGGE